MSLLDWTEPPWCERTQDMSGFVLPDYTTTSPPLDEQLPFTFSTAHNEIDFDIQHPDPSSRYLVCEVPSEVVLGEDFNMSDKMNYYSLNTKVGVLPDTPSTVEEITRLSNSNDSAYFMHNVDEEHSLIVQSPTIDGKALLVKKPGYLSIFDNEEPLIKEDPDFSNCSEYKPILYTKDDMEVEVAEEVVITADVDHNLILEFDQRPFLFESDQMKSPINVMEEAYIKQDSVKKEIFPDNEILSEIDNFTLDDMKFEEDMFANNSIATSPTGTGLHQHLHLDIEAAMSSSNQLLGEGLPDTPEVLKPVLKPGCGFDLVSFLLANGDTNNNVVNSAHQQRPSVKRLQDRRRKKSNLLLSNHKEREEKDAQSSTPHSSLPPSSELLEPTPGPSSSSADTTKRPARKSAMKLKQLMEEGFLRFSPHSSDDEEYTLPKHRRRPSESSTTSSCRRLNFDSDHSSVCDDGAKYRERRDRNNLSSKLSRQKRKIKTEQKKIELKELEEKNARLRKRADKLSALLRKVNTAWLEYCLNVKKENQ